MNQYMFIQILNAKKKMRCIMRNDREHTNWQNEYLIISILIRI